MRPFLAAISFAVFLVAAWQTDSARAQTASKQASGVVTAISASSLTIETSSGGTKTPKTFVLDDKTSVIARGATRATKGQGRGPSTSMIGKGDSVTVSYDETGGTMHAAEVRVTKKAKS